MRIYHLLLQALLGTSLAIFQGHIQYIALVDGIVPQRLAILGNSNAETPNHETFAVFPTSSKECCTNREDRRNHPFQR